MSDRPVLHEIAEAIKSVAARFEVLSDISQKIDKHAAAARDASETQNQTWKEIPAHISELRVPANERAEANTYRQKAHRQQVWLTWGTWLAFIAASIYAGIAAHQLGQMKIATQQATRSADTAACALRENQRQFKETLAQMITQTTAQVNAAKAASANVKQSETFFQLQNRAWLFFEPGDIRNDAASRQDFLDWTVKNVGVTPASSAWGRIHFEISQSVPRQFKFAGSDQIAERSFASQESVKYTRLLSHSFVHLLGPSASLYGWIVYRDARNSNRFHLTEFGETVTSQILELSEPPPDKPFDHPLHPSVNWVQIPELTCYDEGCKDYDQRVAEVKSQGKIAAAHTR